MAGNVALFFRISANIDDLKANLAQAQASVETTAAAMKKMSSSLDGSKLIADANAMVVAIDKLGGVSALTEAEQARVNATVQAALEKYDALGQTAPAALRQLQASTASAASETTTLSESLGHVAGLFGVAFGGAALVQFGRGLLELGETLETTAANTGLTVQEVQRLSYVADQSGSSLDAVTNAVEKLEQRLGTGNTGATVAMKGLGIATSDFLKLDAYEQMELLAQKISALPDPTQRAAAEFELFGRSGQQIGTVLANFGQLADKAPTMSDETVAALSRFEKEIKSLQTTIQIWAGDAIAHIAHVGDDFVIYVGGALEKTYGLFAAFAQKLAGSPLGTLYQKLYGIDVTQMAKEAGAAQQFMHDFVQAQVGQLDQLARATGDTGTRVGGLGNAFSLAKPKADEFQKAVKSMADLISGADVAKKVQELSAAVTSLGGVSKLTQPELDRLTKQAEELVKQGAQLPPSILQATHAFDVFLPPVKDGIDGLKQFGEAVKLTIPWTALLAGDVRDMDAHLRTGFGGLGEIGTKVEPGFKEAVKAADDAQLRINKDFSEIQRGLEELGRTLGGDVGAMVSAIGGLVNEWNTAEQSFSAAKLAFGKGDILGGISNAVSGIGGLASAAVTAGEALKGLWDHFFGTAGRDAVSKFANSMGGFDALHQQLAQLGSDGEKLWINLTQGVGRNNPPQAQAAIDAINTALGTLHQTENSQIADLTSKISALGGSIPAALDPYIEKLQKANILTGDNAAALKALEGDGAPTYDTLQKLQQKYNLTAAQMGPSFQTQQISQNFQTIIDDLDTLTRGGADLTAALFTVGSDGSKSLSGLGQAVDDDIEAAIKAGVQIPANLEPAAKALFDQGDLVDANGKKITDFNALSFGETMQTSLDNLNATLKALIDKLTGDNGLADAINRIPTEVNIDFKASKSGDWPTGSDGSSVPGAATGGYVGRDNVIPFPSYFGVGGFVPRGTDTVPAMLTPGEIILNATQQKRLAGAMADGGGDIVIHHQTVLDGRVIDERIDRVSRQNAARGRLKTRAASGRSY